MNKYAIYQNILDNARTTSSGLVYLTNLKSSSDKYLLSIFISL